MFNFNSVTSDDVVVSSVDKVNDKAMKLKSFLASKQLSLMPTVSSLCIRSSFGFNFMPDTFWDELAKGTTLYGVDENNQPLTIELTKDLETIPWDEAPMEIVDLAYVAHWYASEMSKVFELLLPEEVAELTGILTGADAEGSTVTIGEFAKFDFAAKAVEVLGRSRVPTRYAFDRVLIGSAQVNTNYTLVALACQVKANAESTAATLQAINNLWRRENNYGAALGSGIPSYQIEKNLILPIGFSSAFLLDEFPWVYPGNGDFEVTAGIQFLLSGVLVAFDKYCMKWMGNSLSAAAMGLAMKPGTARDEDKMTEAKAAAKYLSDKLRSVVKAPADWMYVLTMSDASKTSKLFNRPTQGRKFLRAESELRTPSKVRVTMPDGTHTEQWGIPMLTAYTNSRLAFGSGIAILNPKTMPTGLGYGVQRRTSGKISWMRIPSEMRQKFGSIDAFKAAISSRIEAVIASGESFSRRKAILKIDGRTIIGGPGYNRTTVVIPTAGAPCEFIDTGDDSFEVVISTKMVGRDKCLKLRGDWKKITTLPYKAEFFYEGQPDTTPWQIMLNIEGTKGAGGLMEMFIIAMGGGVIDVASQTITLDVDGRVIDLTDPENELELWKQANKKDITVQMTMALDAWNIIQECAPGDDVWEVPGSRTETHVVVEEKVQVIYGTLPYEIEVSTPREATGAGSYSLAQLVVIANQNAELAQKLYAESSPARATVEGFVGMYLRTDADKAASFNLARFEDREQMRSIVGVLPKTDREIYAHLHCVFPNGVNLGYSLNSTNFIHVKFDIVSRLGVFMGSAAGGVADDILTLVYYCLDKGIDTEKGSATKIGTWAKKVVTGLTGWMAKMGSSSKVMKRLARFYGSVHVKIKASYDPVLEPSKLHPLPKVVFHPDDEALLLLAQGADSKFDSAYLDADGKFDPWLLDGTLMGVTRTPMPFMGVFELVISELGHISHATVLPHLFAMLTEGDFDGDDVSLINLDLRGVTYEDALEMNNSVFGFGGYELVYGKDKTNWPYAAFCSYEDKWGKKNLVGFTKLITEIDVVEYALGAYHVQAHYRAAVGISYGFAFILSVRCADMMYAINKGSLNPEAVTVLKDYQDAAVVAWRLCYEGFGLSGYSPKAKMIFELIAQASWGKSHVSKKVLSEKYGLYEFVKGKDIEIISELVKLLGIEHLPNARTVVNNIIWAEQVRAGVGRLERGKKVAANIIKQSAVYGCLRRVDQGSDPAGLAELDNEADDENPSRSTFTYVEAHGLTKFLHSPWMKELAEKGTYVHRSLNRKAKALADAEQFI